MRWDEAEGLEASMGRNWMAIRAVSLLEADWPAADKECRYHFVGLLVCWFVCLRLIKCDNLIYNNKMSNKTADF